MVNKCTKTQGFGQNLNPMYSEAQQAGHTGYDESCGYGSKVFSLKRGWVYKILDDKHPANDGSGYWAVYMIGIDAGGKFCEWQIGHLSKIFCEVGDEIDPWDVIGEEGNKGGVYAGGIRITKQMQDAGDKRGSHRHINKKILERVPAAERENTPGVYLTQFGPQMLNYQDPQGNFYRVLDYKNGYNGSVDPAADIDAGYAEVNAFLKVAEEGIKVAGMAVVRPEVRPAAMMLLSAILKALGFKK